MAETHANLLEMIARALPGLHKSQARVAKYILENPTAVTEMSLADLSKNVGVSEPSVIRFCNSMGLSGYRSMKIGLARSLAVSRMTSHSVISAEDDTEKVIEKIFDFNLSALNWARERIDHERIIEAADAILQANQVQFFGFGASAIVALDAQQKFPLFGLPCGAPTDGHQMLITAAMMKKGDIVVAVSNTGTTREVLQAMAVARGQGAVAIGLTGAPDTPLAQQCDIPIVLETLENTDLFTPTVSRISAMVAVDILSTLVSIRSGEENLSKVREMKTRLASLRSTGIV